ncbi:UDP-N-acetylglucosamine 1-carboxyvinyltransferase [Simkania negevensis]|uniref:UDP-N-acetylglucosamine 1-carboxyvinyltransferase n=1 Tax=Simkania negevensis TaxID=83561 RepID=A0ABS3ASR6_9BACT|nr:UDP-N-acetylglucosamine 1-carboxyvinyltransferase [Simkania negevensis]
MAELFKITGGKPLEGSIRASGAKNAATKLIVASLLSDKKCIFTNVPNIGDVEITAEMCREVGMDIYWDREAGVMEVQTRVLKTSYIPQRFSGSNRIPILMIGALLGRTDQDIIVPTAGGCFIGKRAINFHIDAMRQLGAVIEYRRMKKQGAYFAQAHHGLTGTCIDLAYPSVGATENTILASVRAKGVTTIRNAAIEPEVIDLILFLQKLGAIISLENDRTIQVKGTKHFYDVEHEILPDRLEIASLGMAAIATKGRVFVEGAQQPHLITFLNKLREVGGGFNVKKEGIEFFYDTPLKGKVHIETDVYPGFATDWQQPFTVLFTQAEGSSIVHETVYENRFGYINELNNMGAEIETFQHCLGGRSCRFHAHNYDHSIVVKGPTPLHAKDIDIPDLRAGFAYIMAALIAQGTSTISGTQYIDRGYEQLDKKLAALGADITRIDEKTADQTKSLSALEQILPKG